MNNINTRHNEAMAHMNLINLYQEKFQDVQDFTDQDLAMKKVCDELALWFADVRKNTRLY